jgi:hypothetical protein
MTYGVSSDAEKGSFGLVWFGGQGRGQMNTLNEYFISTWKKTKYVYKKEGQVCSLQVHGLELNCTLNTFLDNMPKCRTQKVVFLFF